MGAVGLGSAVTLRALLPACTCHHEPGLPPLGPSARWVLLPGRPWAPPAQDRPRVPSPRSSPHKTDGEEVLHHIYRRDAGVFLPTRERLITANY